MSVNTSDGTLRQVIISYEISELIFCPSSMTKSLVTVLWQPSKRLPMAMYLFNRQAHVIRTHHPNHYLHKGTVSLQSLGRSLKSSEMEWLEQICTNPPWRISLFDSLLPPAPVKLSVRGDSRAVEQTSALLCGTVPDIEGQEGYNIVQTYKTERKKWMTGYEKTKK
jgi:hypothetical protein